MFWPIMEGMLFFFTFFLMTIYPAHHIYNIQLTENVFQSNLLVLQFSIAAPTDKANESFYADKVDKADKANEAN